MLAMSQTDLPCELIAFSRLEGATTSFLIGFPIFCVVA